MKSSTLFHLHKFIIGQFYLLYISLVEWVDKNKFDLEKLQKEKYEIFCIINGIVNISLSFKYS